MKFSSPASMHVDYPMLFELNNTSAGRVTHCGVLEFVADEGLIYIPYWVRIFHYGYGSIVLMMAPSYFFLFICLLVDDGEHAPTRGRHCSSEEQKPGKGNLCEVAAPHQGLS